MPSSTKGSPARSVRLLVGSTLSLVATVALVHCSSTDTTAPIPTEDAAPAPAPTPTTTTLPPPTDAAACPSGQRACGAVCTNTSYDPANCGACGTTCADGQVCSSGKCSSTCQPGLLFCTPQGALDDGGAKASRCVDAQSDEKNCGACNKACAAGELCAAGVCKTFPSCAAIAAAKSPILDGRFTIKPAADAGTASFEVYCTGMSGPNAKEYLELVQTGGAKNQVTFGAGGACGGTCTAVTRSFTKVRLDPETLVLDPTDFTFSTTSGGPVSCWNALGGACGLAAKTPYGSASNCTRTQANAGTANVDLTGTVFSLDLSVTWGPSGTEQYGSATTDANRKVVDATGGGFCGGTVPTGPLKLVRD